MKIQGPGYEKLKLQEVKLTFSCYDSTTVELEF
jgi:hypothetical protein